MATLTGDVNKQNIVDRFADYVTATANASIVWGTNVKPFTEMNIAEFGGTTAGQPIVVTGASLSGPEILAASIVSALNTETALYTNIRKCRAILFVLGGGGNTGTRPTPGIVFDDTQVSHLNTGYRQSISTSGGTVLVDNDVSVTSLQTFFTNLQTDYNTRRNTTQTIQTNVCHASCHSSCHGSRGRR